MLKSLAILSPLIQQYFDRQLLGRTSFKFRDCSDDIGKMIEEVKTLLYKLDSNPPRKQRCDKLMQEILELYERAKIKEKERESQEDHKTKEFGYSFAPLKGDGRDVYCRLKYRRKSGEY